MTSDSSLHVACRNVFYFGESELQLIQRIIDSKADVNALNAQALTPLQSVIWTRGPLKLVEFLIESKADVNRAFNIPGNMYVWPSGNNRCTPLSYAVAGMRSTSERTQLIQTLVGAKADPFQCVACSDTLTQQVEHARHDAARVHVVRAMRRAVKVTVLFGQHCERSVILRAHQGNLFEHQIVLLLLRYANVIDTSKKRQLVDCSVGS